MNSTNSIKPTKSTLYLLRHGATQGGTEKRYIGQTDIPLSERGRIQASWWQKELSRIKFDAIYSSDLSRAIETVQIVAKNQTNEIQTTSQLREINLGDWDGVGMQEIQKKYADTWIKRGRHMDRFRPPNGESFQDLQVRVLPVVESIDFGINRNVLMVSHAGVNRVILCHLLNRPLKDLFEILQGEAALNLIEIQDGFSEVVSINQLPE